MNGEYTKDRCPCHRCKKIVAELKTEIKKLKTDLSENRNAWYDNLKELDGRINDCDATILRLRNLLYAMYANFGNAEIQSDIEILDKVVKELGLKKEIEVKE